jgi:hypothetical protein
MAELFESNKISANWTQKLKPLMYATFFFSFTFQHKRWHPQLLTNHDQPLLFNYKVNAPITRIGGNQKNKPPIIQHQSYFHHFIKFSEQLQTTTNLHFYSPSKHFQKPKTSENLKKKRPKPVAQRFTVAKKKGVLGRTIQISKHVNLSLFMLMDMCWSFSIDYFCLIVAESWFSNFELRTFMLSFF